MDSGFWIFVTRCNRQFFVLNFRQFRSLFNIRNPKSEIRNRNRFFDANAGQCRFFDDDFRLVAGRDIGGETIAAFRDGFDQCAVAELLPQPRNIARQRFVGDRDILPNLLEKLVFSHDITGVFDEREQQFKLLERQRNYFAIAQKTLIMCIKTKSAEVVKPFIH